jgi:hypothetical protein
LIAGSGNKSGKISSIPKVMDSVGIAKDIIKDSMNLGERGL